MVIVVLAASRRWCKTVIQSFALAAAAGQRRTNPGRYFIAAMAMVSSELRNTSKKNCVGALLVGSRADELSTLIMWIN